MFQKGNLVAFALAGLLATGACSQAKDSEPRKEAQSPAMSADVKCMGVNECAGHGGCKTSANECKGHNGCKGKGFVAMTAEDCTAKGGKAM